MYVFINPLPAEEFALLMQFHSPEQSQREGRFTRSTLLILTSLHNTRMNEKFTFKQDRT